MSKIAIAKRYARALLNLAEKGSQVEEAEQDLLKVTELYSSSKQLREVLFEPKYERKAKVEIISDIALKLGVSELTQTFCRYLVSKNRFELIEDIYFLYQRMAEAKLGKVVAKVVVADGLDKKAEKELQESLTEYTGRKVTLEVETDSSILGGAIATIDSLVLDGSVRNRLNLIRESIVRG